MVPFAVVSVVFGSSLFFPEIGPVWCGLSRYGFCTASFHRGSLQRYLEHDYRLFVVVLGTHRLCIVFRFGVLVCRGWLLFVSFPPP